MSGEESECVSRKTRGGLSIVNYLVLICALVLWISSQHTLSKDIKTEVLQRCEKYNENDCQKIWTAFEQAYVGRDTCDVPVENYDTLIDTVKQEIQCDKTLFWSKSKDLAHAFTKKRKCKMTLEDTLLGYMLDGLTWCSKPGSEETLNCGCPEWTKCGNNPVSSFWKRASANFAASTCGHASVLLNASAKPPYDPDR
ncbi:ADP-ribosyl cyclase/cyclic ADP-ribose hydrolase 1-like [Chanos chanos]|uniref:ADP-ribosyl cyclase/cyclic ADP-ribose hydrolase n=1 Tax=Chanos chanos TaxID=29144 RepID=A0A6J2UUX2_CHACN|nr:ADP-ribosyl cyclase/cyclic ADP-ribose hydrolase 1-like [Chanos chanos]